MKIVGYNPGPAQPQIHTLSCAKGNGRHGPLSPILKPLARLAAPVYKSVVSARNHKYDTGKSTAVQLNIPIISIGNLSVGGTGKTPVVSWVANLLLENNFKPIIAMRGYKSGSNKLSDEQIEHQNRLPNVPVIANPNRAKAIKKFLEHNPEYNCVILDDGFQHRQLARDLDLVLVDAIHPPCDDNLLPLGWLREPPENLARADAVIISHADIRDDDKLDRLRLRILKYHGKPPIASFKHSWSYLKLWNETLPTSWLANRKIFIACAICHPRNVIDMAEQQGAYIVGTCLQKDHANYHEKTMNHIMQSAINADADAVLVTDKDWSKIEPIANTESFKSKYEIPILRPHLDVQPVQNLLPLEKLILDTITGYNQQ